MLLFIQQFEFTIDLVEQAIFVRRWLLLHHFLSDTLTAAFLARPLIVVLLIASFVAVLCEKRVALMLLHLFVAIDLVEAFDVNVEGLLAQVAIRPTVAILRILHVVIVNTRVRCYIVDVLLLKAAAGAVCLYIVPQIVVEYMTEYFAALFKGSGKLLHNPNLILQHDELAEYVVTMLTRHRGSQHALCFRFSHRFTLG